MQRRAHPAQVIMVARVTDPNDMYDKFKKRLLLEFYGNEDPLDVGMRTHLMQMSG